MRKHLPIEDDVTSQLDRDINLIKKIQDQDLQTEPDGTVAMKKGVAAERIVSVNDTEMRHGRESKSENFNGYKEHVAADLDSNLTLAVAVTPANRPEEEAAAPLFEQLSQHSRPTGSIHVGRAYIISQSIDAVVEADGKVLCKPWNSKKVDPELYGKRDFKLDIRSRTITCPAGAVERSEPGDVVSFDLEICGLCPLRSGCTRSASGKGSTVSTREDRSLQRTLRKSQTSRSAAEF